MSPKELQRAVSAILPAVQQEASAERIEAIGIIIVAPDGRVSQFLAATSVRGAEALSDAGKVLQDAAADMISNTSQVN